jgi:hypothetical protein
LQINEGPRTDTPADEHGRPMGIGMEIVVSVISNVAGVTVEELLPVGGVPGQLPGVGHNAEHGNRLPRVMLWA